ncbi:MAG: RNA methyltransferase, partial [Acidaminococcaceae bacterium]|nr:RNA methyltransferase [Acidaminococcaceae bacterium]
RKLLKQGQEPIFLLLGTGFGMEKETMAKFDLILEPIWGPGSYNHLCVRSAAAIMLDRLASVEHEK